MSLSRSYGDIGSVSSTIRSSVGSRAIIGQVSESASETRRRKANSFFHFKSPLKNIEKPKQPRGNVNGGRKSRSETRRPPSRCGLIHREIADKLSVLSVHGKGVFVSVPSGVQKPHGVKRILRFASVKFDAAALRCRVGVEQPKRNVYALESRRCGFDS